MMMRRNRSATGRARGLRFQIPKRPTYFGL